MPDTTEDRRYTAWRDAHPLYCEHCGLNEVENMGFYCDRCSANLAAADDSPDIRAAIRLLRSAFREFGWEFPLQASAEIKAILPFLPNEAKKGGEAN